MEEEKETTVVPEEEETTPVPASTPPTVPANPDNEVKESLSTITSRLDELTNTVATILTKTEPDTTPVKRPWTHWGSK